MFKDPSNLEGLNHMQKLSGKPAGYIEPVKVVELAKEGFCAPSKVEKKVCHNVIHGVEWFLLCSCHAPISRDDRTASLGTAPDLTATCLEHFMTYVNQ